VSRKRWSFHFLGVLSASHTHRHSALRAPPHTHMSSPSDAPAKKGRPASPEVRARHLNKGAVPFEFVDPGSDLVQMVFRPDIVPPEPLQGNALKAAQDAYRTMERKGFQVTRDLGCLVPDDQYCASGEGNKKKGHQRACEFFAHWKPTQPPGEAKRNALGWPITLQISHLCHNRKCCRIDHLVVEQQWRNAKRNYCGDLGTCNCGGQPPCVGPYRPPQQHASELEYCETVEEMHEVLQGARLPSYVIHDKTVFDSRDTLSKERMHRKEAAARKKKQNDAKRKRRQDVHKHATAKKQAKLAKRSNPAAPSGSGAISNSSDFV